MLDQCAQNTIVSWADAWMQATKECISDAALSFTSPSVLFRPSLTIDGDRWCALYGENLQDGVAGFGVSPAAAMQDFDAQWYKQLANEKGGV